MTQVDSLRAASLTASSADGTGLAGDIVAGLGADVWAGVAAAAVG